jgi:hypothetical protein
MTVLDQMEAEQRERAAAFRIERRLYGLWMMPEDAAAFVARGWNVIGDAYDGTMMLLRPPSCEVELLLPAGEGELCAE